MLSEADSREQGFEMAKHKASITCHHRAAPAMLPGACIVWFFICLSYNKLAMALFLDTLGDAQPLLSFGLLCVEVNLSMRVAR